MEINTYVDIATTVAWQGRPYEELRSKAKDATAKRESLRPLNVRSEWEKRIQHWKMESRHNATPIEHLDLQDIKIGALILAHPIPGMAVWNTLQACYELDRVICASPELQDTISGWEELPVFRYLESPVVKQQWERSLGVIKVAISRKKDQAEQSVDDLSVAPKNPSKKDKKRKNINLQQLMEGLDKRISAIRCGVDRLEDLWLELTRTFSQNMKDSEFARTMLDAIGKSIAGKFSMISTALEDEESKLFLPREGSNHSISGTLESAPEPEPKPLGRTSRTNSFKDIMHKPVAKGKQIAVAAAVEKDKEATFIVMVAVAFLAGGLSSAQKLLD